MWEGNGDTPQRPRAACPGGLRERLRARSTRNGGVASGSLLVASLSVCLPKKEGESGAQSA